MPDKNDDHLILSEDDIQALLQSTRQDYHFEKLKALCNTKSEYVTLKEIHNPETSYAPEMILCETHAINAPLAISYDAWQFLYALNPHLHETQTTIIVGLTPHQSGIIEHILSTYTPPTNDTVPEDQDTLSELFTPVDPKEILKEQIEQFIDASIHLPIESLFLTLIEKLIEYRLNNKKGHSTLVLMPKIENQLLRELCDELKTFNTGYLWFRLQ